MNLFRDSIDEIQYRRPPLYRNQTLRHRAVSNEFQVPINAANRRSTNDLIITNIKNQVKELDSKVSQLTNKVDDIMKCLSSLRRELQK
jgi:peptidoglycan hydrolase CwlO-like protein